MKSACRALFVAGAMALALALAAQAASAATSLDVYVGYADNLRANPANFPTPWAGSPGVTFRGCTSGCSWDSSTVRVANNTAIDQTINSVAIRFGTCTISLAGWAGPVTLHPGQQLIVAQTTATPVGGCNPATGSVDGSDIGSDSCTVNDGIIPEVDLTIDGVATALQDTGQVLNTKGVDPGFGGCGGSNESIQWSRIGTLCSGAALTLSPASQTHRVGETATINGTLVNGCGDGLQGATVVFQDASGPNAGLTKSATTNAAGVASISYTSAATGTDVWFAATNNPAGVIFSSNTASVTWTPAIVYTGRAYDVSATVLNLKPIVVTDTGNIQTTAATDNKAALVNLNGPPVSASVLPAEVVTGNGSSTATAGVASASIAIAGVPGIAATAVHTSSTTSCAGSSGSTTIASLTVDGHSIDVSNIAPNTKVPLLVGTLTLNEQTPVPGGLQVNAIHLSVPGVADVVIASSRSDIHNC
jgi:hypothetical protein